MPLAHQSTSHGVVVFGFFHIETDMLLLERLFFFAGDFCAWLQGLAQAPDDSDFNGKLDGWAIDGDQSLGNLHGAIAGTHLEGFLGALYRCVPFPRRERDFRQKPGGIYQRDEVAELITPFSQPCSIPLTARAATYAVEIGPYLFDRAQFLALVDYLWRGGMPGWQEGRRPDYLDRAARAMAESDSGWFQDLDLDPSLVGVTPGI